MVQLRNIVVGTDHSEEGRAAVQSAARLAQRCGAAVTVLTVISPHESEGSQPQAWESLKEFVRASLRPLEGRVPDLRLAIASGLPGVEIVRRAEAERADLVVLGRKHRTEMQRLLIGDTADSVARRSGVPCLFTVAGSGPIEHVLVALDGTERGMSVLISAMDFTRDAGARLHGVSVEPAYENEQGVTPLLTSRSARLLETVAGLRATAGTPGVWEPAAPPDAMSPIVFHRGRVVEEIVHEIVRSRSDVLVVGYRRGGPAGVIEAGSVARRLAHESPCSVLTIPL